MTRARDPLLLGRRGWLVRLLDLYLEAQDPLALQARLDQARRAAGDLPPAALAAYLIEDRLGAMGLATGGALPNPALRDLLEARGVGPREQAALGILTAQWDVAMDVAAAWQDPAPLRQRQQQVLVLTALSLRELELAQRLEARRGKAGLDVGRDAARVERLIVAPRPPLPWGSVAAATLDARHLARLAAAYYERQGVDPARVHDLHQLVQAERVELIEVLILLAWADGHVAPQERELLTHLLRQARLDPAERARLTSYLDAPPTPEQVQVDPVQAPVRRFILEQAVLLSLVDEHQSEEELTLLRRIATGLGGDEAELESTLVRVWDYYARRRSDTITPTPTGLGVLGRRLQERAQAAVTSNLRAIVTEIKETGELAQLLGAASFRSLSPEELARVKAQLLDVARTVPALTIFALPGGALLLPVLVKALPFQLLPSAFNELAGAARSDASGRTPRSQPLEGASRETPGEPPRA